MIDDTNQIAQTQPTGTATGQTAGNGTGTATGNGTGAGAQPNAGASGGDGGNGLGNVIDIDPWNIVASIGEGFLSFIIQTTQALIDLFNRSLLTIPASGTLENPASWVLGAADDPYWVAMAGIYVTSCAFVLPWILLSGGLRTASWKASRGKNVVGFIQALIVLSIGFGLLNGWNHFWNAASLGFAPSGEEFLRTPGNSAKFGAGLAAVVGLVLTGNSLAILVGVVIHAVFVFLTYALVALFPVSYAMYYTKAPVLSSVGISTIVVTLSLGPLQWLKSALLRVIFSMPIQPENPETFFTFLVTVVGVAIAFAGVPYFGIKRMLPRTIVGVGMGGLKTTSSAAGSKIREKAPSRSQVKATLSKDDSSTSRSKGRLNDRGSGSGSSSSSRPQKDARSTVTTRQTQRRRSGIQAKTITGNSMRNSGSRNSTRSSARRSRNNSTNDSRFSR